MHNDLANNRTSQTHLLVLNHVLTCVRSYNAILCLPFAFRCYLISHYLSSQPARQHNIAVVSGVFFVLFVRFGQQWTSRQPGSRFTHMQTHLLDKPTSMELQQFFSLVCWLLGQFNVRRASSRMPSRYAQIVLVGTMTSANDSNNYIRLMLFNGIFYCSFQARTADFVDVRATCLMNETTCWIFQYSTHLHALQWYL